MNKDILVLPENIDCGYMYMHSIEPPKRVSTYDLCKRAKMRKLMYTMSTPVLPFKSGKWGCTLRTHILGS